MNAMNNKFIEINNWLKSDRNYEDGVYLYSKYGNNHNLKNIFPGKEKFQSERLAYELSKLIGMSFQEFNNSKISSEFGSETPDPQGSQTTGDNFSGEHVKGQASTTQKNIEYPNIVKRIIYENSRLYKERAMLKKQQNDIPDENTPENIAKRKKLIDLIEAYSERISTLSQSKDDYFEKGILPDENVLFPKENVEQTTEDLETRLKNLRSYQSKDNNLLLYQRESKQVKENPLPDSPKKDKIVKRMEAREKEISEIEQKLKDAAEKEQTEE